MKNWYLDDIDARPMIAAHEFGHMLGLWDEYLGGWTDPSGKFPANDPTSVMGQTMMTPYARHYEDFRSWLAGKDASETFTISAVIPEPATLSFLGVGIVILVVAGKRRRLL